VRFSHIMWRRVAVAGGLVQAGTLRARDCDFSMIHEWSLSAQSLLTMRPQLIWASALSSSCCLWKHLCTTCCSFSLVVLLKHHSLLLLMHCRLNVWGQKDYFFYLTIINFIQEAYIKVIKWSIIVIIIIIITKIYILN